MQCKNRAENNPIVVIHKAISPLHTRVQDMYRHTVQKGKHMKVTPQDLATWAKSFSIILANERELYSKRGVVSDTVYGGFSAAIRGSISNTTPVELSNAIRILAEGYEKRKSFPNLIRAMQENYEVFNTPIVWVFAYGLLYNELEKSLLRFAEHPEQLAYDYFGPTGGVCKAPKGKAPLTKP